ncbi:microtubule binding protein [Rutstroemia sp. NJR-2017a WRK4]|nr:microtubule binding protein [Rutstroemia sp. NJR-2017a WRK4]
MCASSYTVSIAEDIDPDYAVKNLPTKTSSTKWVVSKQRLEAVYKALVRYIHEHGDNSLNALVADDPIDFNALAQYSDAIETAKLLTIFLSVVIKGPDTIRFVERITKQMDSRAQEEIANLIKTIDDDVASVQGSTTDPAEPKDDLAWETKYGELSEQHAAVKKRNADLISRLEHLSASRDDLQERFEEQQRQTELLQAAVNQEGKSGYLQDLERRLEEANELIQSQEQQLYDARVTRERQNKELLSLKNSQSQESQDTISILRVENEALAKKANMVDHYQKKLAQLNTIEKDNARLREQLDVLQENQNDYDRVYQQNEIYQATHEEFRRTMQVQENNLIDLRASKQAIEEELMNRIQQVEILQDRQRHDEKFIEDLQEKLNTQQPEAGSPKLAATSGFSLEDELSRGDVSESNLELTISRLRAENQVLKSKAGGKTNAELRVQVQDAQKTIQDYIEKTQRMREDQVRTQDQLSSVLSQLSGEGSVTAVEISMNSGLIRILTNDYHREDAASKGHSVFETANQEIATLKQKNSELIAKVSSLERDLLAVRADLAAMSANDIAALEELKVANQLITSSYEHDLTLLQAEHDSLKKEFADQESHLFKAIREKDQLSTQLKEVSQKPAASTEDTEAKGEEPEPNTTIESLKQVSRKTNIHTHQTLPSKKKSIWRKLYLPRSSNTSHSQAQDAMRSISNTDHDAELNSERAAFGSLPVAEAHQSRFPSPPRRQLEKKEAAIQELQQRLVLAEDPEAQKVSYQFLSFFDAHIRDIYILCSLLQSTSLSHFNYPLNMCVKAANDLLVKTLTKENAVIATAWYDLTSRLQSNHVVLQRRQDAPKSWLGKQRQLVNSGPRR